MLKSHGFDCAEQECIWYTISSSFDFIYLILLRSLIAYILFLCILRPTTHKTRQGWDGKFALREQISETNARNVLPSYNGVLQSSHTDQIFFLSFVFLYATLLPCWFECSFPSYTKDWENITHQKKSVNLRKNSLCEFTFHHQPRWDEMEVKQCCWWCRYVHVYVMVEVYMLRVVCVFLFVRI